MFRLSLVAILVASSALAADLALTPEDVANWPQASATLDACVASLELRGDPAICRGLAQWLTGFAGRVAIASRQPAAPPVPLERPIPSVPTPGTPARPARPAPAD